MTLRTTLAGTAILATILGTGALPFALPAVPAQAQSSISINVFYDGLADHGEWVNYENRYVFVPADIDANWRPYTLGHWVNAERYGWTWVSDEPFGWATYHYGRWGFSEEIGWYWVPGTVWAPAWVSWKRTPEYVVWAPLPVDRGYDYDDADIRIDVNVGDIPDYYWVAVPAPRFLEVNLNVVIINDDRDRVRIVREAEPLGSVKIVNNIVVNNVVNVNFIEERTGRDVKVVKVRETNDPKQAKSSDDEIVAVPERIAREENAKPGEVADVEKVKREKQARQGDAEAGDQPGNAAVDQGDVEQGKAVEDGNATAETGEDGNAVKRKKQSAGQGDAEPGSQGVIDEQDSAGQADDQATGQKAKNKQRKAQQPDVNTQGAQGVIDENDQVQQGEKKAKRKKKQDQQSGQQGVIDENDQAQQGEKKAKRKKQQDAQSGTQGVIDENDRPQQGEKKAKRKKKQDQQSEQQGMIDQQDVPQGQGEAGGDNQPAPQNEAQPPVEPMPEETQQQQSAPSPEEVQP